MAKKNLIGGSLWEQYSQKVASRMNQPKFFGEFTEEDAKERNEKLIVADYGAESCGDSVRLYWLVNSDNVVTDARFKSFGCGTAIASSDMMCELCVGKTIDETLKITNIDVEKSLRDNAETPAVPPQKMHCSVMAYDVIKKAVSLAKNVDMDSLETEIIVCECARVTLTQVEDAIRINDLKTVEEITQYTKAGAFCKSCIKPGGHEKKDIYLIDILKRVRAEMSAAKLGGKTEKNFAELSMVQQIKAIENIFDAEIRPALAKDKGGLSLEDLNKEGDDFFITIRYEGACRGCAGALTGTLNFIERTIREKLGQNFYVQAIQ